MRINESFTGVDSISVDEFNGTYNKERKLIWGPVSEKDFDAHGYEYTTPTTRVGIAIGWSADSLMTEKVQIKSEDIPQFKQFLQGILDYLESPEYVSMCLQEAVKNER